ncbi:MAG: VanZ family protein [Gemmatimonadaceae bacterium]
MTPRRAVGLAVLVAWAAVILPRILAAAATPSQVPVYCVICGDLSGVDALLNVLVFIPLGIGLRLAGLGLRGAVAAVATVTAAIELTQLVVLLGRVASVADLVTNTAGGAAGALLASRPRAVLYPAPNIADRLARRWALGWLGVLVATAWGYRPSLPRSNWYGQRAPTLAQFDRFTGTLVSASVGGVGLPDARLTRSDEMRRRLLRDDTRVEATLIPGTPTARAAPIASIFDDRQRQVVFLGQTGPDLMFELRTVSAAAGFRTPVMVLPGVVANDRASAREPLRVAGWRSGWWMYASAEGRGLHEALAFPLRPTTGWSLILPFEHIFWPQAVRFTMLWLGALLLPAGYWMASAALGHRERGRGRPAARTVITIGAVLGVGLAALPIALDLPPSGASEWGGSFGGLAAGWILAVLATLADRAAGRGAHRDVDGGAHGEPPDYIHEARPA